MNAWNPVYAVGDQIVETLLAHDPALRLSEARERVAALYTAVGLSPDRRDDFPHEYSGGMKQRAVIAMALACNPKVVIADEPTTALDVIVQREVLGMIRQLQQEIGSSVLFVTHDLGVHAALTDRLGIMYAGRLVEEAPTAQLLLTPRHPYTRHLIASLPRIGTQARRSGLPGSPPNLADPATGCRFHPRCPIAMDVCRTVAPDLRQSGDDHRVACHAEGGGP
jgi:peptide/nickel transport system ATP-binding protein